MGVQGEFLVFKFEMEVLKYCNVLFGSSFEVVVFNWSFFNGNNFF